MRQRYRLLLVISTTLFMLSACGSSMNLESNRTEETTVLMTMQESATEETTDRSENEEESKEISEKNEEAVKSTASEASAEQEDEATKDNKPAVVEADSDETNLTGIEQSAVEALVDILDLEIDQYSYLFTQKADYIEIEVRENTDDGQAHAHLEGIYRYFPVTKEVFISDYLTGDFILYEEYQELQNN